jgi:hypothetical protein
MEIDHPDEPLERMATGDVSATTDATGEYVLDNLAAPVHRNNPARVTARDGKSGVSPTLELPDHAAIVDLQLQAGGGIDGTTDEGQALVTISRAGDHAQLREVFSDGTGAFHVDDLAIGEYVVEVSRWRNHIPAPPVHVTIVAGQRANVTLAAPSVTATLAIRADAGTCHDVAVQGPSGTADDMAFATCDDGVGVIAGVPPGSYEVCADATCMRYEVTAQPAQQDVRVHARH